MRILVVGGGGREHALAWRIAQDRVDAELFVAPGNGGTAGLATNVPLAASELAASGREPRLLAASCRELRLSLRRSHSTAGSPFLGCASHPWRHSSPERALNALWHRSAGRVALVVRRVGQ